MGRVVADPDRALLPTPAAVNIRQQTLDAANRNISTLRRQARPVLAPVDVAAAGGIPGAGSNAAAAALLSAAIAAAGGCTCRPLIKHW